eukprot:962904-Pleurochrysis_carterae.AAC.1
MPKGVVAQGPGDDASPASSAPSPAQGWLVTRGRAPGGRQDGTDTQPAPPPPPPEPPPRAGGGARLVGAGPGTGAADAWALSGAPSGPSAARGPEDVEGDTD